MAVPQLDKPSNDPPLPAPLPSKTPSTVFPPPVHRSPSPNHSFPASHVPQPARRQQTCSGTRSSSRHHVSYNHPTSPPCLTSSEQSSLTSSSANPPEILYGASPSRPKWVLGAVDRRRSHHQCIPLLSPSGERRCCTSWPLQMLSSSIMAGAARTTSCPTWVF
jgi:hypothetical protein